MPGDEERPVGANDGVSGDVASVPTPARGWNPRAQLQTRSAAKTGSRVTHAPVAAADSSFSGELDPSSAKPARFDRWWLAIFALFGALGVLLVVLFHDRGVPIARIEFNVLGPGAERAAREFLTGRGVDLAGYQTAVSFETDSDAQGYVERTAGQRELDRIAADEVTIWRWRVRFFRELEPLEYAVSVAPAGQVVGWSRTLPEAGQGASLDEVAARTIAEGELRSSTSARIPTGLQRPAEWQPVGAAREARPNRVDYRFTWERGGFQIGEATQRRTILVQGDQIAGDVDFLRVPERWTRESRIETNRGIVLANVGWTLSYALALGAGLTFLAEWRAGRTRRRVPLLLTAGFVLVGVLALANQVPIFFASYPTTASLSGFLIGQIRDQATTLVPQVLAVVLAAAAGLAIWSRAFPDRPHPAADLSLAGMRTGRFATGILVGYLAAGMWLGYFTLFYWVGTTFLGVWSPVELPYRDVMSGAFPAAFPLFVGAGAAIAEETIFRLFAIPAGALAAWWIWARLRGRPVGPAARRWLLVLVVVVVALVWGSLHSTYPQRPFYIRALEVSIIGILAGAVLLRWGLVATMATHYVGNASIVGALFTLSGNRDLQITAAIVVALPLALLIPWAVGLISGRGDRPVALGTERRVPSKPSTDSVNGLNGFPRPDDRSLDGQAPPHHSIPPSPFALHPSGDRPVTPTERSAFNLHASTTIQHSAFSIQPFVLLLLSVFTLLSSLFLALPRPGDRLGLAIGRSAAVAEADRRLATLGVPGDGWIVLSNVADLAAGSEASYLLRTVGPAETERIFAERLPAAVWQVRYARPLVKDEVWVLVGPAGGTVGYVRQIDEAAPGASPDPAAARLIADRVFRDVIGDPAGWDLVSSSQIKREQRVDSVFTYEQRDVRFGEATIRVQVGLLGDQPGSVRRFLKVPEAFLRELSRETALEGALGTARDLLTVAILVAGAILFLRSFRAGRTDLHQAGRFALAAGIVWLIGQLLGLPSLLASYRNTLDLPTFTIYQLSLRLRDGMLLIVTVAALASLVRLPAGRTGRAWLNGVAGAALALAAGILLWGLRARLAPDTLLAATSLPPVDSLLPAGSIVTNALLAALTTGLTITLVLQTADRWIRSRPLRLLLFAAAGGLWFAADGQGLNDVLFSGLAGAAVALLLTLFWNWADSNVWSLLTALVVALVVRDLASLARPGNDPWLLFNAALLVGAALALVVIEKRRANRASITRQVTEIS